MRRAYDLVKTAFRLWSSLRSKRFQSSYCAKVRAGAKKSSQLSRRTREETLATQATYDLVKIRLSESEAEKEEPNQSQKVGTCINCHWSILPFLLPTPTIWFSLDRKRNVSGGVGRNGNVLILLTPIPSRRSLSHERSNDCAYDSDSDSVASESQHSQ